MPGSILSLITPFSTGSVLFGLYDYLLPIMLYCAWSSLAFMDLAAAGETGGSRVMKWSAGLLLFPLIGAAAYLLWGNPRMSRFNRIVVVGGGLLVMAVAYGYTWIRIT